MRTLWCAARLRTHRAASGRVGGGRNMPAAFLVLPEVAPGQSAAKAVETAAIKLLAAEGFGMLSTADARGRQLPSALAR